MAQELASALRNAEALQTQTQLEVAEAQVAMNQRLSAVQQDIAAKLSAVQGDIATKLSAVQSNITEKFISVQGDITAELVAARSAQQQQIGDFEQRAIQSATTLEEVSEVPALMRRNRGVLPRLKKHHLCTLAPLHTTIFGCLCSRQSIPWLLEIA